MRFRFLVDNKTEDTRCMAEWGLSILIETGGKKILLDTGASGLFAENGRRLGVDLAAVDALVISHGHYDHTGGVAAFAEANKKAPIYLHKKALGPSFGETNGVIDKENCGIRWSEAFYRQIQPRLVLTEGVQRICDGVTLVGNIPDYPGYEVTERFWRRLPVPEDGAAVRKPESEADVRTPGQPDLTEGPDVRTPDHPSSTEGPDVSGSFRYVQDDMQHEQFLVVEEDAGLYLFSGCSHRGVVPTIRYAQSLFPGKRIAGLIAGMHLYPVSPAKRAAIVSEIADLNLDFVFPVHCSGMEAILMLKAKMGDRCVVACAGDVYEY